MPYEKSINVTGGVDALVREILELDVERMRTYWKDRFFRGSNRAAQVMLDAEALGDANCYCDGTRGRLKSVGALQAAAK